MKIAVIYYSYTKHTDNVANIIQESIKKIYNKIEVRKYSIENIDYEYLNECSGVIFGTPTYYGNSIWKINKWFEESKNINLEGKLGAAFSTANYVHGGGETAIQTINNFMIIKGMLVYTGGSALGKPYIHSGPIILNNDIEYKEFIEVFALRFAKKCNEIFSIIE